LKKFGHFSPVFRKERRRKKNDQTRGATTFLSRFFFFFFLPQKKKRKEKKKRGKEKQKVDQRCSFSLFATLSRCGSDCKNTEKTGVFFFRFWKSQRAAEINALDGKQQISLFLRVSDEPHVSKNFFQKKKRRKQPGLHQQPSSLQVVSIRGSKGFFFFFFFGKLKKKTSSTRTLTCECVFVFTMFTHRVLTQTSSKFTVLFSSATPQWCNKEFFARHLTNGAKKKSWRKLEAA
jgi:hypothetical protein